MRHDRRRGDHPSRPCDGLLAGAATLRQHLGNLSIGGFIGACVGVAVHSALEAWWPSLYSLHWSVGAFAVALGLYMRLAVTHDWNRPNEFADAMEKAYRKINRERADKAKKTP